jgi:hypothetical protein
MQWHLMTANQNSSTFKEETKPHSQLHCQIKLLFNLQKLYAG